MKRKLALVSALTAVMLLGCQSTQVHTPGPSAQPGSAVKPSSNSTPSAADSPSPGVPLAFVNAKPVDWTDLRHALIEESGGEALADVVIDAQIKARLAQQGKSVAAEIENERKILLDTLVMSLNASPDQAQALLDELRDRHGLGEHRFSQLLYRNAGLRLLVAPDVKVTDMAVNESYELRYGPRYEARIITTGTLADAEDIVHRAGAGESFSDLAARRSTDSSKVQGGLLSPISPVDPSYPDVVRAVLVKLSVGGVSGPVAMEKGYAVLKLEKKIAAQNVKIDDVKAELRTRVRLDIERMRMQSLASTMIQEADVVVMDSGLKRGWTVERQKIVGQQP